MDFLKSNLFYVILVAAVLVICIPSFIVASSREKKVEAARNSAGNQVRQVDAQVGGLKPVSTEAIERAKAYQAAWQSEVARTREMMAAADKHLDGDFLVPVTGGLPSPEAYRTAYYEAFTKLHAGLEQKGLLEKGAKPIAGRAYLDAGPPTAYQIRVTQKQYWILEEVVKLFSDPECGVTKVTSVQLDAVPNDSDSKSRPDNARNVAQSNFWIYPLKLEFEVDFRKLPVFFSKLVNNQVVCFIPDGYTVVRGFDESQPVYVPVASVTLYCQVWDYVSTDFEKSLLSAYKPAPRAGAGAPAGRRR